jgi:hypothetical protein
LFRKRPHARCETRTARKASVEAEAKAKKLAEAGVAGVVEGLGERLGQSNALVELSDGEQPGFAGKLARRRLDHEWRAEKVEDLRPGRRYTHRLSPWGKGGQRLRK